MYNKAIVRFDFCDILNNQGLGKCYQPRPSAWLHDNTLQEPYPIIVYYYSFKISPRFLLVKTTRIIHHKQEPYPKIVYYYSFKISPRFLLVKTTRIIHHKQLLFTKWQKFCHIEPMTPK